MRFCPLVFVWLLGTVLPCVAQADDQAAIRAVIAEVQRANNAGDVDAWVGQFAADAVYMPPGGPTVQSLDGLRAVAEAGFRHQADIRIAAKDILVSGDLAVARTQVTGSVRLHGSGEVVAVDARQLVAYRKDSDGRWRIVRMMSNSEE